MTTVNEPGDRKTETSEPDASYLALCRTAGAPVAGAIRRLVRAEIAAERGRAAQARHPAHPVFK